MLRPAIVAAALASALFAPAEARACHKRHQSPFELFDLADTVAVVTVRSVPSTYSKRSWPTGRVELTVKQVLKGQQTATLTAIENHTDCRVGFRVGRTALVMLAKDGAPVGHYEGYLTDVARWQPVIAAWAAATSDADRVVVLVDAIRGADRTVSHNAASYLVHQRGLLSALIANQRASLVANDDYAKLLAETQFETETDPGLLADAIERGNGGNDPVRIAAFEQCERVRATRLHYSRGFADGAWPKLAEACRTGIPYYD